MSKQGNVPDTSKIKVNFGDKRREVYSEEEYTLQAQDIQQRGESAVQSIVALPLRRCVERVGNQQSYDVVVKVEDVILFANDRYLDDISDDVWTCLQSGR